jgi:hypothetical protein
MSPEHQAVSETRIGVLKAQHWITLIGKLRSRFSSQFAKGCTDTETLREVLHRLDEATPAKLVADHEIGDLESW